MSGMLGRSDQPPMGILLLAVHRDAATGAGQPR
jgi:hypothetical protein